MALSPRSAAKIGPNTAARAFTSCGECDCQRAKFECLQCHERYCHGCAVTVHHRGRRTRHSKFLALPFCGECDAGYADVRCAKCDEFYCRRCAHISHSKGNRAQQIHLHAFEDIAGGIPAEPPHLSGASGATGGNSYGIAVDALRLDRHPDAIAAEAKLLPISGEAAAGAASSTHHPKRLNVVDGYGSLIDAHRAESEAAEALEAAKLRVPKTDETIVVVDGEPVDPNQAPQGDVDAVDDMPGALTSAVAPLTLTPMPVRVPRAVQQGAADDDVAASAASLKRASETAAAAAARIAPLLPEFRTWRRRGDGSDAAAGPPVLFGELKDPLTHRQPAVPVTLSPAYDGSDKHRHAAAGSMMTHPDASVNGGGKLTEDTVAALVPFFEAGPLQQDYFLLAVAAVIASNGTRADGGQQADGTMSNEPSPTAAGRSPGHGATEDRNSSATLSAFPKPNPEIFRGWFASAERLFDHEMATFRFYVAHGSTWARRHDSSCADTRRWQRQAAPGEAASAQQGDRSSAATGGGQQAVTAPVEEAGESLYQPACHFTTVDTLLPALQDRRPAFGRTESTKELWLSLLMKAYAVAHPDALGVAALHLDTPAAAFEPLTGGAMTSATWSPANPAAVGTVWWILQMCALYHLPCAVTRRPDVAVAAAEGSAQQPSVDIRSDAEMDRRPWAAGDVFLSCCEYRFDAGVAEALVGLDDGDDDAKSTTSAATAGTGGFDVKAAAGGAELHRLIKLRQLYSTSRSDDESGWLPPWHDEGNLWSDVAAASNAASRVSGRAQSIASTAARGMSVLGASTAVGQMQVRWNKITRRVLQHPVPDERLGWLDASTFASRYNTILLARNLAQQARHKLHFGLLDRISAKNVGPIALPHFLLAVRKRPDAANHAEVQEAWRTTMNPAHGVDEILSECAKEGALGSAFALGDHETDDDDIINGGNSPSAASQSAEDEAMSASSSRAPSVAGGAAFGGASSSNALLLRVTVTQPCPTAAVATPLSASLRNPTLASRQNAAPAVTFGYVAPLQVMAFRASAAEKQGGVSVLSANGMQQLALPMHSRVALRLVSTSAPTAGGGWVETVYEMEANTGHYNLVVCPDSTDSSLDAAPGLDSIEANPATQPFAIAVSAVRNSASYDIATQAL